MCTVRTAKIRSVFGSRSCSLYWRQGRIASDFESVCSLVKDTVITEENQLSGAREVA